MGFWRTVGGIESGQLLLCCVVVVCILTSLRVEYDGCLPEVRKRARGSRLRSDLHHGIAGSDRSRTDREKSNREVKCGVDKWI